MTQPPNTVNARAAKNTLRCDLLMSFTVGASDSYSKLRRRNPTKVPLYWPPTEASIDSAFPKTGMYRGLPPRWSVRFGSGRFDTARSVPLVVGRPGNAAATPATGPHGRARRAAVEPHVRRAGEDDGGWHRDRIATGFHQRRVERTGRDVASARRRLTMVRGAEGRHRSRIC